MKLCSLSMLVVFAALLQPLITWIAKAQEPGPNRGVQEEPVSPEKKERRTLGARSLNDGVERKRKKRCAHGISGKVPHSRLRMTRGLRGLAAGCEDTAWTNFRNCGTCGKGT